jgi:ABC-type uncharacterized transport system ATPase component
VRAGRRRCRCNGQCSLPQQKIGKQSEYRNKKGHFISTISQELNNGNIGKYTMEYCKKVNKLRENRKVTCRKVKNRACSTDSNYGQKCEALPECLRMNMKMPMLDF